MLEKQSFPSLDPLDQIPVPKSFNYNFYPSSRVPGKTESFPSILAPRL